MLDHAGGWALYLGPGPALCGVIVLPQVGAVGLRQAGPDEDRRRFCWSSGFFLRRSAWSVEGAGCGNYTTICATRAELRPGALAGLSRRHSAGEEAGDALRPRKLRRLQAVPGGPPGRGRATHTAACSARWSSEGGGAQKLPGTAARTQSPRAMPPRPARRAGPPEDAPPRTAPAPGADQRQRTRAIADRLAAARFRPACPVTYVVAAADRLSPPPLQRTFAHRLDARVREYPGGHLAALADPRFLRALIESNN
ncbi:hypothetical protein ACPA9J_14500 [Pseudomonas aeruginosa]